MNDSAPSVPVRQDQFVPFLPVALVPVHMQRYMFTRCGLRHHVDAKPWEPFPTWVTDYRRFRDENWQRP